jgi:hypothetical protein
MLTLIQYSRRIALGAALAAIPVAVSSAQKAEAEARWQPWIGCWRADQSPTTAPAVCVSPTASSSAVQIATIDSGRIVMRDTINADGASRHVAKGGCTGTERAHFSADANRVYLRSDLTCAGGIKRVGTGLLSIAPDGDWINVQGTSAGGNSAVRATRFHETKVPASELPIDIAMVAGAQDLSANAARTAAGAPLSSAVIVEAVKELDTAVVQTWIVQRGTRFKFDAKELVALADAGVPGSVTDVLIGVSYPDHFALQERSPRMVGGNELTSVDSARLASQYLNSRCYGYGGYDPFFGSLSSIDPCSSRYGLYGYNPYRYNSYGYSPYGYGYGYGYGSGYVSYAPVVVVKGSENPHGHVVNGHGYTRDSGSGTSGSYAGSSGSSRDSGSGGSGGGGSASSGSSSSGSSSSSGGRTAHAKP